MKQTPLIDAVVVLAKAVLLAAAIILLGGYFGLHVREAGGTVVDTVS